MKKKLLKKKKNSHSEQEAPTRDKERCQEKKKLGREHVQSSPVLVMLLFFFKLSF